MIGMPLVIAILYVWCMVNADQDVSFYFGSRFKVILVLCHSSVMIHFDWLHAGHVSALGACGIQCADGRKVCADCHIILYVFTFSFLFSAVGSVS